MNILDENIPQDQQERLRSWRIPIHQIGYDVGRKGMKDSEIIPLLFQRRQPTFFTRDQDFCDHDLCHTPYCLVFLDVEKDEAAVFVRRLLRHPECDTKTKRMGAVIRVSHAGLSLWRLNGEREVHFDWP